MYVQFLACEGSNLAQSNIFSNLFVLFTCLPLSIYLLSFLNYYFRLVKLDVEVRDFSLSHSRGCFRRGLV